MPAENEVIPYIEMCQRFEPAVQVYARMTVFKTVGSQKESFIKQNLWIKFLSHLGFDGDNKELGNNNDFL